MPSVLVVDDSSVDRLLVGGLIEKDEELSVTFAANGTHALTLMRQAVPAIVVTDLVMPEMDGLELVTRIRDQYPFVPVILMTSKGNEQVAVQAKALESTGHRLAFLEAALLVETGFYKQLDGLVVVSLGEEAQVERVMARDGCSRGSALARIRAQKPLADKIGVADHVIDNSGSAEATRARLVQILQVLEPLLESNHAASGGPTRS